MQKNDYQPGDSVWCQNCGKHHVVEVLGVNPCKKPDLPDSMSEREKRMMIMLATKKGLKYDRSTGKFIKKNENKKVD